MKRIRKCFFESLGLEKGIDLENLEYQGVDQWDSAGHMALVAGIEDEFDIMMEVDDVIDMSGFQKCKEILKKYGIEFES